MLNITQKELETKVRKYAKMLGINDRLTDVCIDENGENLATTYSIFNDYSKNKVSFRNYELPSILHELLHVVFQNTVNMMHKIEDETLREIFLMLHEQEIEAFSQSLADMFVKLEIED